MSEARGEGRDQSGNLSFVVGCVDEDHRGSEEGGRIKNEGEMRKGEEEDDDKDDDSVCTWKQKKKTSLYLLPCFLTSFSNRI